MMKNDNAKILLDLELQDSFPPVTALELDAIECRLKLKLPESYRSFMLKYNGGDFPHLVAFPLKGKPEAPVAITSFFHISKGSIPSETDWGELVAMQSYGKDRSIPDHFIFIASAGNGMILLSRHHREKVYFFDPVELDLLSHEQGNAPFVSLNSEEVEDRCIYLVADSFIAFLDSLYQSPDRDPPHDAIPVFRSVQAGAVDEVEVYLDSGGDPNLRNKAGVTLLMAAANASWPRIVDVLLQHHADANSVDQSGRGALHHAVRGQSYDSICRLIIAGADVCKKDVNGDNPLEYMKRVFGQGGPRGRAYHVLKDTIQKQCKRRRS